MRQYAPPQQPMYYQQPVQPIYIQQAPPPPPRDNCCCGCCNCCCVCFDVISKVLCCLCLCEICCTWCRLIHTQKKIGSDLIWTLFLHIHMFNPIKTKLILGTHPFFSFCIYYKPRYITIHIYVYLRKMCNIKWKAMH